MKSEELINGELSGFNMELKAKTKDGETLALEVEAEYGVALEQRPTFQKRLSICISNIEIISFRLCHLSLYIPQCSFF